MDTEVLETAVVESVEETDLYHRPGRITRISTMTNIISWVILAIGVFIFGYLSYSLVTSIAGAGPGVAFSANASSRSSSSGLTPRSSGCGAGSCRPPIVDNPVDIASTQA